MVTRMPTVEQVRRLVEAIPPFINVIGSQYLAGELEADCRKQEDTFLGPFTELADSIRPLRSSAGTMQGWPGRSDRAIGAIVAIFDAIAAKWGWEKVALPEPARTKHIRERHDDF